MSEFTRKVRDAAAAIEEHQGAITDLRALIDRIDCKAQHETRVTISLLHKDREIGKWVLSYDSPYGSGYGIVRGMELIALGIKKYLASLIDYRECRIREASAALKELTKRT